MIIGIPKEIKNNENRVALTPAGAKELVKRGHTVYVQHTAGINSGFADDAYVAAGARILPAIEDVYGIAEMIVKVKEPIASEYLLVRKGQLVFTYFHFASDEALTLAMIKSGSICLAYETVENPDHTLPLLIPMSEVAGRMSVQEGARFLEKPQGGKGVLLGGVPGVKPGKVLVLGGGVVGHNAAVMAACNGKLLSGIIVTCLLTDEEKIALCRCVSDSGADYIKTSTGFSKAGAAFHDVELFAAHVAPHVKIKAAGGISSLADAEKFIMLGATRLGTSRIVKIAKGLEGSGY